jgi:hypothetical protein
MELKAIISKGKERTRILVLLFVGDKIVAFVVPMWMQFLFRGVIV